MLNFWKVPPLAPHPAHLAVQIFAVLKPVVSESKVLECNKNIKDLGGFYLHTNSCGLQEGIKAAWVCIIDSKINELENKEEATSGMTFIKCGLSLLWIISVWSHQGASLKSSSVVEAHTHMYLITSLPTHTHTNLFLCCLSLSSPWGAVSRCHSDPDWCKSSTAAGTITAYVRWVCVCTRLYDCVYCNY